MAPVSTLSQYPTGIISVDETDPTFLPPMGQITVTKQAKVAPGNAVPAILVGIASAVILVAIVLHLVDRRGRPKKEYNDRYSNDYDVDLDANCDESERESASEKSSDRMTTTSTNVSSNIWANMNEEELDDFVVDSVLPPFADHTVGVALDDSGSNEEETKQETDRSISRMSTLTNSVGGDYAYSLGGTLTYHEGDKPLPTTQSISSSSHVTELSEEQSLMDGMSLKKMIWENASGKDELSVDDDSDYNNSEGTPIGDSEPNVETNEGGMRSGIMSILEMGREGGGHMSGNSSSARSSSSSSSASSSSSSSSMEGDALYGEDYCLGDSKGHNDNHDEHNHELLKYHKLKSSNASFEYTSDSESVGSKASLPLPSTANSNNSSLYSDDEDGTEDEVWGMEDNDEDLLEDLAQVSVSTGRTPTPVVRELALVSSRVSTRGDVGIELEDIVVNGEPFVMVSLVKEASPWKGQLFNGDIILSVDNSSNLSADDMIRCLGLRKQTRLTVRSMGSCTLDSGSDDDDHKNDVDGKDD